MNKLSQHERMLYPVARIRAIDSGGSGTVIYSKPDPQNPGTYLSFILTNQHVVGKAIATKEEWDNVLQRDVKRDVLAQVTVETFDYDSKAIGNVISANSHRADVVAYSKEYDLAVLKLQSPRQLQYPAKLIPEDKINDMQRFDDVWVCGCSLLHDPFATHGNISYLQEVIDNQTYLMMSSHIIFGNSGGALFLENTGELIAVPARVSSMQLGFGVDILTWMGFAVHPANIYAFFREQEFHFLFDERDNYYSAMERRMTKREAERRRTQWMEESHTKESEV